MATVLLTTARYRATNVQTPSIRVSRTSGHPASQHNFPAFRSAATQTPHLGNVYEGQNDYRRAIDFFGETVAALEGALRCERHGQIFLPAVQSRALLAWCHAELGTFAKGEELGDEGLRIAEGVEHPASLMIALYGIGKLSLRQGDLRRALPLLERSISICREADLASYFTGIAATLGAAYTLAGRVADAVPLLTQAVEQSGAGVRPQCLMSLSEAYLLAERHAEAYTRAERALELVTARKSRGMQAWILRKRSRGVIYITRTLRAVTFLEGAGCG